MSDIISWPVGFSLLLCLAAAGAAVVFSAGDYDHDVVVVVGDETMLSES